MNQDLTEIMTDYLSGNLSPEIARAFEQRIEKEPETRKSWYQFLAEQYVFGELDSQWTERANILAEEQEAFNVELQKQRDYVGLLKMQEQDSLRAEVEQALPRTTVEDSFRRRRINWIVAAAAIILALVALKFGFERSKTPTTELFAEYFEPYEMLLATRAGTSDSLLNSAVDQYQDGRYDLAKASFGELLENDSTDIFALYYAVSSIAAGQPEKAIQVLESTDPGRDSQEHFAWYTAMAHLATGNTNDARQILNDLDRNSSYYQAEASAILRKLE